MEPSAKEGDFVLVWNLFYKPKLGDSVVFKDPGEGTLLLKRITRIDGQRCWLEGENSQDSRDSRRFGWISKKAILGKAYVIHTRPACR